ncbi:hypothetical protein PR048_001191 [Dryococelus australis]|uniref:Uncharacterized protein n=1 Tax=Dryococelus australis TaxID=614101 RepID=A0ABQ9IHB5_9NEOP|nr:hypothetical protein PR048_001191 [Dryococelus australis]
MYPDDGGDSAPDLKIRVRERGRKREEEKCEGARESAKLIVREFRNLIELHRILKQFGKSKKKEERLPPTKVNRVRFPTGPSLNFRIWESCRTLTLFCGFSRGSPIYPALESFSTSIHIIWLSIHSLALALKHAKRSASKVSLLTGEVHAEHLCLYGSSSPLGHMLISLVTGEAYTDLQTSCSVVLDASNDKPITGLYKSQGPDRHGTYSWRKCSGYASLPLSATHEVKTLLSRTSCATGAERTMHILNMRTDGTDIIQDDRRAAVLVTAASSKPPQLVLVDVSDERIDYIPSQSMREASMVDLAHVPVSNERVQPSAHAGLGFWVAEWHRFACNKFCECIRDSVLPRQLSSTDCPEAGVAQTYHGCLQGLRNWKWYAYRTSAQKKADSPGGIGSEGISIRFGNLSTDQSLYSFDEHLADRSYVEGYQPSKVDADLFDALASLPLSEAHPHVSRWFHHIRSFGDGRKGFAQKKEMISGEDSIPNTIVEKMDSLVLDDLKSLSVPQIKKLRSLIDEAIQQNDAAMKQVEQERNNALKEVGNHLHESVPVSNDEVNVPALGKVKKGKQSMLEPQPPDQCARPASSKMTATSLQPSPLNPVPLRPNSANLRKHQIVHSEGKFEYSRHSRKLQKSPNLHDKSPGTEGSQVTITYHHAEGLFLGSRNAQNKHKGRLQTVIQTSADEPSRSKSSRPRRAAAASARYNSLERARTITLSLSNFAVICCFATPRQWWTSPSKRSRSASHMGEGIGGIFQPSNSGWLRSWPRKRGEDGTPKNHG